MSKLDWPPPRPKATPDVYRRFTFPDTHDELLMPETGIPAVDIATLVRRRRSGSSFLRLEPARLEALLAYSFSTLAVSKSDPERQLRPIPSAGALHPLHLLLSEGRTWFVYLPHIHALRCVLVNSHAASSLWREVREVRDPGKGMLLLVLAEAGVVAARYDNPETLLLRESGCLLGHMGLIAEALNLSYRILGPTGEPWAHQLVIGADEVFVGVGTALIGGRAVE